MAVVGVRQKIYQGGLERGVEFSPPPIHAIHPAAARHPKKPARPVGGAVKRITDVAIAGAALVFLAPVMLGVAIAVRLETSGPVLFRQRRGGYRGQTFLILKFRTMTVLDDGHSVAQAEDADPRVTRLGALLRKTSLDELPQLINVLKGDMSLVGPRPHAVAHDAEFGVVAPNYLKRRRARPGITGLAQISGSRGKITSTECIHERVRYDLTYMSTWSLWNDFQILFRTALLLTGHKRPS
ncbi:MAG: sugar transferase [Terricaulis sp.]